MTTSSQASSLHSFFTRFPWSVIGHNDREGPLRDYCTGLLQRKSVEPMAAITAPHRTAAQHQSLLHFIGEGKWSDEKVLAKVREMVVGASSGRPWTLATPMASLTTDERWRFTYGCQPIYHFPSH
jgi:SRSO17 transposase